MRPLSEDLRWRGLYHQATDEKALAGRLDAGAMVVYIGFDPTAGSLHIGHLQQMCLLRRFQAAGHRPIALVGGGTGMIGDPSGKSEERNLLSAEELDANRAGIRSQLESFLGGDAILADNSEWLAPAGLLEFLRDVGKHFSVNEMVRKDSVRARLEEREQSLSFTEFSYMLLQAWDFVALFDRHGCELQLGGSDQWGNITEGIRLIRRLREGTAYGLTSPLVTKADGTKFGKTESGAVWLDPARTSPYTFYQFWLRTGDADAGNFLRRFSLRTEEEIEALEASLADHPERREAQRALAVELTAMVHGGEEARRAEAASAVLFTEGIAGLDEATLAGALGDAPSSSVGRSELVAGVPIAEAVQRSGLASSGRDARQKLSDGAIYVNGRRAPGDLVLTTDHALHGRWVVLRRGRASQHVLVVEG